MKYILSLCCAVISAFIIISFLPVNGEETLYDNVIRLHVIADSDSEEDQAIKLRVRDRIIAEIGDIHRFSSQASVAKFAGLVWTQHQSGEFEAEHSRMIKSGNRYLRYYLLEAANSVRRCDSEFRRYYDLKFKEVNKYQHKRALALTARKLVRLVFRLLKDNRLYILPEG